MANYGNRNQIMEQQMNSKAMYSDQYPIELCRQRGSDHGAYGWSTHIPDQWNAEQISAYREAYSRERAIFLKSFVKQ